MNNGGDYSHCVSSLFPDLGQWGLILRGAEHSQVQLKSVRAVLEYM